MKGHKVLFLFLLGLAAVIAVNAFESYAFDSPCIALSEKECVDSYNSGYHSDPTCNTMFYCYPKYTDGVYSYCSFVPRTNFSSCSSSSVCYDGIAVDTTQFRKCFCDAGIEFKTVDPCGNTGNWSGVCLDLKSCNKTTKYFLKKPIDDYSDCAVLTGNDGVECGAQQHDEIKCYGTKLVTTRFYYKSNECGNGCVVDRIATISEKQCDSCEIDKCVNKPTVSRPKTDAIENDNSSGISGAKGVAASSDDVASGKTHESNMTTSTNAQKNNIAPSFSNLKSNLKINIDVPASVITTMLVFVILFLSGLIFLLNNR